MPGKWWDRSWNAVTGCTPVSTGCVNCYARMLHERRRKAYMGGAKMPEQYHVPFEDVQCHLDRLDMPLHVRKPSVWFVNSMSDLFHHEVGSDVILRTLAIMALCPQHRFVILTKRAERMAEEILNLERAAKYRDLNGDLPRANCLLGVSAERFTELYNRGRELFRLLDRGWRFLVSFEPLLADVCTLKGIWLKQVDWVIVGGESGAKARYMHPGWVRAVRNRCQEDGTPFWFKQWGRWKPVEMGDGQCGRMDGKIRRFEDPLHGSADMIPCGEKLAGRTLDGREWNERPADFPKLVGKAGGGRLEAGDGRLEGRENVEKSKHQKGADS